jgi:hypothetical protein
MGHKVIKSKNTIFGEKAKKMFEKAKKCRKSQKNVEKPKMY